MLNNVTDGKGNITEYSYDALGQVTNKKVHFAIDNNSNMQYTNYRYSYGGMGNVVSDSVNRGTVTS